MKIAPATLLSVQLSQRCIENKFTPQEDEPLQGVDTAGTDTATLADTAFPPLPDIVVEPGAIEFTWFPAGSSVIQTLTISNVGSDDLQLEAVDWVSFADAFTLVFRDGLSLPTTIAPGADVILDVVDAPLSDAGSEALLQVLSDDPDEGTIDVPVRSEGCESAPPSDEYLAIVSLDSDDRVMLLASNGDGTFAAPEEVGISGGVARQTRNNRKRDNRLPLGPNQTPGFSHTRTPWPSSAPHHTRVLRQSYHQWSNNRPCPPPIRMRSSVPPGSSLRSKYCLRTRKCPIPRGR